MTTPFDDLLTEVRAGRERLAAKRKALQAKREADTVGLLASLRGESPNGYAQDMMAGQGGPRARDAADAAISQGIKPQQNTDSLWALGGRKYNTDVGGEGRRAVDREPAILAALEQRSPDPEGIYDTRLEWAKANLEKRLRIAAQQRRDGRQGPTDTRLAAEESPAYAKMAPRTQPPQNERLMGRLPQIRKESQARAEAKRRAQQEKNAPRLASSSNPRARRTGLTILLDRLQHGEDWNENPDQQARAAALSAELNGATPAQAEGLRQRVLKDAMDRAAELEKARILAGAKSDKDKKPNDLLDDYDVFARSYRELFQDLPPDEFEKRAKRAWQERMARKGGASGPGNAVTKPTTGASVEPEAPAPVTPPAGLSIHSASNPKPDIGPVISSMLALPAAPLPAPPTANTVQALQGAPTAISTLADQYNPWNILFRRNQ